VSTSMVGSHGGSPQIPHLSDCPLCGRAANDLLLECAEEPVHHVRPTGTCDRPGDFGKLAIVACGGCGHIYNAAFDPSTAADLYEVHAATNAPVHPSMVRWVREIANFILDGGRKPAQVLEIGCGTGALARAMVEHVTSIDLIEPNLGLTTASFGDPRITFLPGFFPAASIGKRYDLIVCRQVLEHIADPAGFLDAIRIHLANFGQAYIEIPCADYILANASVVDFHYLHVQYFTRAAVEQLFARVGFEVVRSWLIKKGHDVGYVLRARAKQLGPWEASTPFHSELRSRLQVRRRAGCERLQVLGSELALYGACAYSQALLGLFPDLPRPTAALDDTEAYAGHEMYHRCWRVPVLRPTAESLREARHVIICAYLHDRPIADKLSALGFRGTVHTLRADSDAGCSSPISLFAID